MQQPLRLATWNVQSFRAGLDLAVQVLGSQGPDVVLLQECGSRPRLARFAGELGMDFVSSHRPFSRVRNAVLFSPGWRANHVEIRTLTREGRTLRRGFVAATLQQAGRTLTAASAHLGLAPGERERQARELTDLLAGREGPVVLGIDLNEGPESPAARWIAGRLYDAFAQAGRGGGGTLPARAPTVRIDYLFVGEGIRVLDGWVPSDPASVTASDHRPVLAAVELSGS